MKSKCNCEPVHRMFRLYLVDIDNAVHYRLHDKYRHSNTGHWRTSLFRNALQWFLRDTYRYSVEKYQNCEIV